MSKIFFYEPYSGTKISYNKVHRSNPFRWKDKNFPLTVIWEGEKPLKVVAIHTDNIITYDIEWDDSVDENTKECYETYLDFDYLLSNRNYG